VLSVRSAGRLIAQFWVRRSWLVLPLTVERRVPHGRSESSLPVFTALLKHQLAFHLTNTLLLAELSRTMWRLLGLIAGDNPALDHSCFPHCRYQNCGRRDVSVIPRVLEREGWWTAQLYFK